MGRWRAVAVVTALVLYALASHALMVHAPAEPWTVGALFGPLLVVLTVGGWKRRHAPTLVACAGLTALLAAICARGGIDVNRLYVLQHAAIHLVLGATFAFSLRPGSKPLITAMAERVHEQFPPPMRAYTRRLTALWAVYFGAMIVVSLLIYALAPWSWWSFYCNLVTPLSAALFFVGEHVVRYRRHPDFERVSLAGAARAWRAQRAAGTP